ncbi:carboxyl-terminal protease [Maribacter algarum]|uniref:Carboxyl-terminal protease n=1 Tax=Maribacter algarum (ex Zhang et al. 2020) TaxID=2578118 RepID=A0A5S3PHE5_9FLAO|nr:S41 family peptidase [Maribacter algarum]TMM53678.1 carboxyl-terminal protease [Maribacter algarum]
MKDLKIISLFFCLLLLSACSKKADDFAIPATVDAEANAGVDVQDFMWKAMNYWYFWQEEVPNLADDKFPISEAGTKAYTEFLKSEANPADFLTNQLRFSEDRFTFFSDDYTTLTNSLAGISKSNGLEFGLINFTGSDSVFGLVRYIIPGSDAANKDISRGEIFTAVDGQALTTTNFRDLLFGDVTTYTLNMADFVDNEFTLNGKEVSLTKEEGLAEDPIFLDKIFEISGEKIGYLVYNGFINEFDEQLNEVFSRFKSGGVTNLVLDMRYNPGGDVNSSALLSSMVYGTNTNDVFLKAKYNNKYQAVLQKNNIDVRRFFRDKTPAGTGVNTLNLSKVYILTTKGSASATELVINGLEPYVDVIQIGDVTRGKNEFSVTLVDDRANRYIYSRERENQIKSSNNWALQPLVGRNENADGFSEYTAGLTPDFELKEDLTNMGVLGDQNEPLLAKAIELITGTVSGKRNTGVQVPVSEFTNSKMFTPVKDNMYVTDVPFIEIE